MRILHCIQSLEGGGAERQLVYLAGETVRAGHEVHVASLREGAHYPALQRAGAIAHRIAHRGNYDPLLLPRLVRLIKQVRADVVQTWLTQMDVVGGAAALLTRVPWILAERSSEVGYTPSLKNRLRIFMASRAAAIVSNSAGGDAYWESRASRRTLRRVVPNAVPMDGGARSAKPVDLTEYGLDPARPLLLYVGRFSAEKNLETLAAALEIVLGRSQAAVALCGTGPLFDSFARRVSSFPKNRMIMPGFVADVWPWLRAASALINIGLYEGHPNAVMEAMAAETPVIVSDIPAHREILDDRSALFVDARVPESVAAAILQTLEDPATARERARQAGERVTAWSLPAIARQYIDLYEAVLER